MYGLKMFKIWCEMSEQVRVETSWYNGLTCLRDEMSVSLSQSPRESSRSESVWVSLKYCFTSAWLLTSFPDFSAPSRVFVNVYWFQHMQVFPLFSSFFCILVLAYSPLFPPTLGWSCGYAFFWFVVVSLWLSSQRPYNRVPTQSTLV